MPSDFLLELSDVKGESTIVVNGLPIADLTSFSAAQLARCSITDASKACDGLTFQTFSFSGNDVIRFNFIDIRDSTSGHYDFIFADGSFDQVGRYTSVDGLSTLNISVVPEAATWLIIIVGFGMIGSMLRRRRNAVVV